MPILLPTSVSPHKSNHLLHIQKKIGSLLPLSVGEIVEVKVIERLGENNLLILLKNRKVLAGSDLPLEKGEKKAVRVEQLHPRVVLQVVENKRTESSRAGDCLRFYRSHPKALLDFFMEGNRVFNKENPGEIALHLGRDNLENVHKMLRSLIISKQTLSSGFFKDYIYNLGYLMEKDLKKAFEKRFGRSANVKHASYNLKGFLLKMSDRLQSLAEKQNSFAIEKLLRFVDSSLKMVEAHQAVNVMLQENENEYVFQIPVLFPEKVGLAEIFFKFNDPTSKNKNRQKQKKVLFVLNMDALGDIIVEAKIEAKKISCEIKCESQKVHGFIVPFLRGLEEKLEAAGYDISHVRCVVEKDMSEIKNRCHGAKSLYDQEMVDVLA